MEKKKKILILGVDAGAAHRVHSQALHGEIEKLYPGKYEIRGMDYDKEIGAIEFDKRHKKTWSFLLRHSTIANIVCFFTDVFAKISHKLEMFLAKEVIEKSIQFIKEYIPDIIICVHPHTIHMAVITKERLGLNIPVIGIIIEPFYCNCMYVIAGINKYIVYSEGIRRKLCKNGISEEKTVLFNFIIRPIFIRDYNSVEEVRKSLAIDPDKLTILMTSGGEGIGKFEKYIKAVMKENLNVQLIVITGRNTVMEEKLRKLIISGNKTALKVFGYMDDMSNVTYAADIYFGKAGGCTTIEGLCMKKPIMYFKYVGEHERQNIVFIKKNGLGWYVPTAKKFVQRLKEVIENHGILEDIKEKYDNINIKSGTEDICRYIVNILEGTKGKEEAAG